MAVVALHEIQLIASWGDWHLVAAVTRRNVELELAEAGAFVSVNSTREEILECLK